MSSSTNKRIFVCLVVLVIVLPIITGILVWQLLPGCDDADESAGGKSGASGGQQTTTVPVSKKTTAGPGSQTTTEPFEDGPWKTLRLPTDKYIPTHYDLTLFPDFYDNETTFYGNVSIEIKIRQDTSTIMVHVLYLDILSIELKTDKEGDIEIARNFSYPPNQFFVVETKQNLKSGAKVFLNIEFRGSLTRSIVGFYKSIYTNSETKQDRYVRLQFI